MELSRIQNTALHNYYIMFEVIDDQMGNIKPFSLRDHHVDNNVILITVCWWQVLDVGYKKFIIVTYFCSSVICHNFMHSGKWLFLNVGDMTWYQSP